MLSRRAFLAMAGGAAATSAGVGAAVWAALVRDHVDAAFAATRPTGKAGAAVTAVALASPDLLLA